jgi:hypothetical protein
MAEFTRSARQFRSGEPADNARMNQADDPEHRRRLLAARRRVERLAYWLDGLVLIPGTQLRFGIDSLIGLIPGVGDFAGMLMGGAILSESLRAGAPNRLVLRMLSNTLIDGLVGTVPLLGDLFDFAFRSNAMNARLLLEHLDQHTQAPVPSAPAKRGWLLLLVLLVPLAVFALAIYAMFALFRGLA